MKSARRKKRKVIRKVRSKVKRAKRKEKRKIKRAVKKAKRQQKKIVKKSKKAIKRAKKAISKDKRLIQAKEATTAPTSAAVIRTCKKLVKAPKGSTDDAMMCGAVKKEGHCRYVEYARYCLRTCGSCIQ